MDWSNIIIAGCSVIGVLFGGARIIRKQFDKVNKKLDEMSLDIRKLDSRISRIEGYIERDLVEKYRPSGTGEK